MERKNVVTCRRSSGVFLPKRYTRSIQGAIGRVDSASLTVVTASSQRCLYIGPYTIVCRRGRTLSGTKALRPGARARVLFVVADEGPLAVLVELLDRGTLGDRTPPTRGATAAIPTAAAMDPWAGARIAP